MKVLLVTEKCNPTEINRDGGARLVETLKMAFGNSLNIIQFGKKNNSLSTWSFEYPFKSSNRFENRINNAEFIIEKIRTIEHDFTHIFFIHVSMQFGLTKVSLRKDSIIWTFPMFLTPSYLASGEMVPDEYTKIERLTLSTSKNIITPSRFEKQQLIDYYSVPKERIHVIPRGIDVSISSPKVRTLKSSPKFCSIGSIKPQKNTLGLISSFAEIQTKFKDARLKIIGPVQNEQYYKDVLKKISSLGIEETIEFKGYVPPNELANAVQECHIHLSRSTCETFGRSIFETLSFGLPNIARKTGNAASEFIGHLPYAKFIDDDIELLDIVSEILTNLPQLSLMATEVGRLFDDQILSKVLSAKIHNNRVIAISDFDGTLFHKNDQKRTEKSIEEFKEFPIRVVCSARSADDILSKLKSYNLEVNWIIGCSGCIVTDGNGNLLWTVPLVLNGNYTKLITPEARLIKVEEQLLQIAIPKHLLPDIFGLRVEIYDNTAFIFNWQASKLQAVHRLLKYIDWHEQVQVFGDGIYDMELLNYFDGIQVRSFNG